MCGFGNVPYALLRYGLARWSRGPTDSLPRPPVVPSRPRRPSRARKSAEAYVLRLQWQQGSALWRAAPYSRAEG